MSTPNSEVIMFTPIPKPDELIQIQAEVTKPVTQGYQWIIMKCRLLIFSESDIIASPAVGSSKQIHIISSRHFFNKGKLQTLLLRHNMEGKEAEPVSKEIYESCLHYSILARLSPLWNYVEPFLIQGVNFLTETRIMNAVKIQIVINDDNSYVIIWPQRVKLSQLCLSQLVNLKKNLSEKDDDFKYDFSSNNESVFALPRMTPCRIDSIERQIPSGCDLASYTDFKNFWKKKYGYKLPETDEEIYYVTVRFAPNLCQMTYPNLCVRPHNLITLPHSNFESVLESFSCDLSQKLPNICGMLPYGLKFQTGYAVSKLNSSTEIFMYPNWSPNKQVKNNSIDSAENTSEDRVSSSKEDELKSAKLSETKTVRGLHFTDVKKPALKNLREPPKVTQNDDNNNKVMIQASTSEQINQILKLALTSPSIDANRTRKPTYDNGEGSSQTNDSKSSDDDCQIVHSSVSSTERISEMNLSEIIPKLALNQQITLIPRSSSSSASNPRTPNVPLEFLAPVTIDENQTGIKRPGQPVSMIQTPEKKRRSKPQVQEDINVEEYARKGFLANANVATLLHFLKKNCVQCKAKDKKSDLIIKVLNYLQLPIPTENLQSSNS